MIMPDLEISPNIYYTPEEVAAMLRVSRRSVRHLLESGIARGIKIGRHWRILGSDILRLPDADDPTTEEVQATLLRLSEPSFARVWDNEEDAIYDEL